MSRLNALAAVALAAALVSCGNAPDSDGGNPFGADDERMPAVEAVEVRYGSFPLEERLAGSVKARNQTEIYARVAGTIDEVYVNDGDKVTAGEPLVRLRSRDFEERVRQAESGLQVAEARVRQAQANLTRVKSALERTEAIIERGLGTAADLDTARADAAAAQADLDLMAAQRDQAGSVVEERRAALADTLVKAPIDGVVGGRHAEVGQQANTSTPLFVIGDTDSMLVEVTLTQRMLSYIDVGHQVNIHSDVAPDRLIEAKISRISPFLHPVAHTTKAEIYVDRNDGLLRPGMFVSVDVLYGASQEAPLVPNSAIYRHPDDGREGVFVANVQAALTDPEAPEKQVDPISVEDPIGPVAVRFVPIDVVARGRMASGVQGIREGDWVVTIGHRLLVNSSGDQAIVQPTPWEHILDLQQLQSRDLLDIISEKQRQNEGRIEPN